MIQNHILYFFRKSIIAFPFLFGSLFLVMPQIGFSAAIETSVFDIDPFPLNPTESNSFFLDITKKGSCTGSDIELSKSSIDLVKKEIIVGLKFVSSSDDNNPCHFRLLITNTLPKEGQYLVKVFDDGSFNEPQFFGSFNLTVASKVAAASSIPTVSEWTLILIASILVVLATNAITSKQYT